MIRSVASYRRLTTATTQRLFSYSLQNPGGGFVAQSRPTYQVFGDEICWNLKVIPPEFRLFQKSGTMLVQKKGRLFLEWVPKAEADGRFLWEKPLRFALSVEEMGLWLKRLKEGTSIELHRQGRNDHYGYGTSPVPHQRSSSDGANLKVFRAETQKKSGSLLLTCDYENEGRGGQTPAASGTESQGPLSVELTVGEAQVVQSIVEYSLPRLSGWSPLMDKQLEQAMASSMNPSSGGYDMDGPPF